VSLLELAERSRAWYPLALPAPQLPLPAWLSVNSTQFLSCIKRYDLRRNHAYHLLLLLALLLALLLPASALAPGCIRKTCARRGSSGGEENQQAAQSQVQLEISSPT